MAAKVKTLDVWLTDGKTVYKEVPYTVVIDWLQQGRLLAEDQVRPSGTEKWYRISNSKTLSAYLPRAEPNRVEDQAEALEPVAMDFTWKPRRADEDDDPDMIPLIDISLVLLVFFMMTATVIVASTNIDVPPVSNGFDLNAERGTMWVGIDWRPGSREGLPPKYSFGEGEKAAAPEDTDLTEAEVVQKLGEFLRKKDQRVGIRITAARRLPAEIVQNMTKALESLREKGYISEIRAEVNEKKK